MQNKKELTEIAAILLGILIALIATCGKIDRVADAAETLTEQKK